MIKNRVNISKTKGLQKFFSEWDRFRLDKNFLIERILISWTMAIVGYGREN